MSDTWWLGTSEDNFSRADGDSKRAAMAEARVMARQGKCRVFVGRGWEYRPSIDGRQILEQAQCDASDAAGYDATDSWLMHVSREGEEELGERLTKVFREWLRETGHLPDFTPIDIVEEVTP